MDCNNSCLIYNRNYDNYYTQKITVKCKVIHFPCTFLRSQPRVQTAVELEFFRVSVNKIVIITAKLLLPSLQNYLDDAQLSKELYTYNYKRTCSSLNSVSASSPITTLIKLMSREWTNASSWTIMSSSSKIIIAVKQEHSTCTDTKEF